MEKINPPYPGGRRLTKDELFTNFLKEDNEEDMRLKEAIDNHLRTKYPGYFGELEVIPQEFCLNPK